MYKAATLCATLEKWQRHQYHVKPLNTTQTVTYCQALKLGEQLFEFARNFLKRWQENWEDVKTIFTMEECIYRHRLWDPYLPRLSQSADCWSVQTQYYGKEWVQVPLCFTARSEKQTQNIYLLKCISNIKIDLHKTYKSVQQNMFRSQSTATIANSKGFYSFHVLRKYNNFAY